MKMGILSGIILTIAAVLIIYLFVDESLRGDFSDIKLQGKNDKTVVILPGLSGTPTPFEELARRLNKDGYTVIVPLLKNHGGNLSKLSRTSISEVEDQARQILERSEGKKVIVAECSSSLIALKLADELKIPAVLINPPLKAHYGLIARLPIPYIYRFDIGLLKDRSQLYKVPRYSKYPISFLRQQMKYRERVKLNTSQNLLIFHSKNDIRAPYSGVKMLASVAPNSEVFILNNSGHLPYLDVEKEIFYAKLKEFLERQ